MELLIWLVLALGTCFFGYWAVLVMAMTFMVAGIYLQSVVGVGVAIWLWLAAALSGE